MYRKHRHCPKSLDKASWWNQHLIAYQQFKQALRKAKQVSWHVFCKSLLTEDFSNAMSKVKLIKSRSQRQSGYIHVDGAQAGANAIRDHLAIYTLVQTFPQIGPNVPLLIGLNSLLVSTP